MKKILILIFSIFLLFLTVSKTHAFDSGNQQYGSTVPNYFRLGTSYQSVLAERNPWDRAVGWTDYYYYYTYYLDERLQVRAENINENKFTYVSNHVTGKYEFELNYRENRELSFGIGFEDFNTTVIPSIKFYQTWDYRYAQGEEVTFYLDGYSGYVSTLAVSLYAKLYRRTYIVEMRYGNVFEGNELMEQTIRFIPNTEEVSEILWDYDLVPILWTELKNNQSNLFINYELPFHNITEFNGSLLEDIYIKRLPVDLQPYYYY